MSKRLRRFFWITGSIGIFLIPLLTFLFLLPTMVNMKMMNEQVLAEFSRKVGGKIRVEEIDLRFLPRQLFVLFL